MNMSFTMFLEAICMVAFTILLFHAPQIIQYFGGMI